MSPHDRIFLTQLKVLCIIGIFPWERKKKQSVLIDLDFPIDNRRSAKRDRIEDAVDYKRIAKSTIHFVKGSRFHLLESLAEDLATFLLERFQISQVHLKVSKPGAIRGSRDVGVEITRESPNGQRGEVYLSLGSNINPWFHLTNSLHHLSHHFAILTWSHVYETSPVGGRKGQAPFWNMVLKLKAEGSPNTLKKKLDLIEREEGRGGEKDPMADRTLDLDLILWAGRTSRKARINLPHPDIFRKAFVIYPMLEIAPTLIIPGTGISMVEVAAAFSDRSQRIRRLLKLPFPH